MDAAQMNELSPVVSKRKASWDGIKLEHYRFREGSLPEHVHQEHLITFSLTGCNGLIRAASGFQARGAGEESVCVIPSGHAFSAQLGGDSEQLAIYLDPALVLRAADDSRVAGGHAVQVVEGFSQSDPIVKSVGLALLSELESEGLGGRLYAESLANVLAVHLLRHYTAQGGARRFKGGLPGRKERRVLAFIADNYESDLSLAELAGVAGMSAFHFAREFKRTTGTSPHQYLINFRVERAKSLLTDSEMPLVEISSRAGFSHQSHFTRLFRRLTGMTPQSYRLTFQP
ncbi:MAG: AraC family transcriptional regulator [Blastocatellia bacterium]|jgi:AraC family transcriptional regulator|nr:AraC family transcriptional regulator [Blastocatellia bacterium]